MDKGPRKSPVPPRESPTRERGPHLHLDVLEDTFAKVWRKRSRKKALAALPSAPSQAARFSAFENTLTTLASAFAEQRVLLRPAETAGGCLDGAVLLPQSVHLAPDLASNRDFLFLRAVISGLHAGSTGAQTAPDEAEHLSVVLPLVHGLAQSSSSAAERIRHAAQLELHTRVPVAELTPIERPLESLRRQALHELVEHAGNPENGPFADALSSFRTQNQNQILTAKRGFVHRLMRSRAPSTDTQGGLLLLGAPLSKSERDTTIAALASTDPHATGQDAEERAGQIRDHVQQTEVDEDPYKENMPSHSFEKVDFADKYEGGFRRMDGADDMEDQGDSLDGVDLREMIRGGPEVQTIYQAEIGSEGKIPDVQTVLPHERALRYDEWDNTTRCYKKDWVTLYETPIFERDFSFGQDLRSRLTGTTRRALTALEKRRTERLACNRQLDGDDLDLDQVVEEYVERRRTGNAPGRIYVHKPRLHRDVATLVLLDLSFSADSWVQNQRVLDLELAAACVLGEVTEKLGDTLGLQAFASNTRNLCRTWKIKDFDESWPVGLARLGTLKPQGYTRIGPAIRHGTETLLGHHARKKRLVVVTDGKPTDFDRYEGQHGVHDVAWAVREAKRKEVAVHAIGLDPRAATILPVMFGPGGWRVLRRIGDLPEILVESLG